MKLQFSQPITSLPPGTPAYIAARCEVLNGDQPVGYFEKHDFAKGLPVSSSIALDLEDITPCQCYAFRDLNGMTQLASRDREHLLQRIVEWLSVSR